MRSTTCWYLGLVPPFDLNLHVLSARAGSDIFCQNHMIPNPIIVLSHSYNPPQPFFALNLNLNLRGRLIPSKQFSNSHLLVEVCRHAQAQQPDIVERANLPSKHAILPNPYALFSSQRHYFFSATKSQSTRQIFFSDGGTTCEHKSVILHAKRA